MPAVQAKLIANLLRLAVGHDAVEALAVQVHHPDDVAQVGDVFLRERLPDVALIEFRVPHQGDEALGGACAEMIVDVGLHERGERSGDRGQPERACGEIDGVFIFGAARVGLKAAEGAQVSQALHRQIAPERVGRVQHGRGVGLDGQPVSRLEPAEEHGRHQAHDGG